MLYSSSYFFPLYIDNLPDDAVCNHCVKSVQIRSYFWSLFFCIRTKYGEIRPYFPVFGLNTGKYGPEITPYLDTFHAANIPIDADDNSLYP